VGWAKIILPLCALALLSTLFLFARATTEPHNVPLPDVEPIAREHGVNAPEFSGTTPDWAVIAIGAGSADPAYTAFDAAGVPALRMRLRHHERRHIEVTATEGEIDGRARMARFLGLARLTTSNGYQMETNGLTAELTTGQITSDGLLEIHAPFGTLTAGKITYQAARDGVAQEMLFTEGVRLLYLPQTP